MADDRFMCRVCWSTAYDPVVYACGHMMCYTCCLEYTNPATSTACITCLETFQHRPNVSEMLQNLVCKVYPIEEKDDPNHKEHLENVEIADLKCPACDNLLFKPTVLHCGDAYCMSCIPSLLDNVGKLKCQCGVRHPERSPSVCIVLEQLIQECFPSEHKSRQDNLEGSSSGRQQSSPTQQSSRTEPLDTEDISQSNIGVSCDGCNMDPIIGNAYRCEDCEDFDLCEDCYFSGYINKEHTRHHTIKLNDTFLFDGMLGQRGYKWCG